MPVVRSRTLTAVAAIVLAAGGVATANAVAIRGPSTPVGPELEVRDAVVRAVDLYPTSSADPDPTQVATGVLQLDALAKAKGKAQGPVRVMAACECQPGSVQAQQFEDLVIEVHADDGGKVYAGPLAELDARILNAEKTTVKVWLADTGKPQAQGVVTEFSFIATETG